MTRPFTMNNLIEAAGPVETPRLHIVEDDMMTPTLRRKDHVLIDASDQTVTALGGVYALDLGAGITLRRVCKHVGSDLADVWQTAPHGQRCTLPLQSIPILGRVVIMARELDT